MPISCEWGKELQAQHFNRKNFPFQGFCVAFALKQTDENDHELVLPQKTQTFYIAEPNTKDNHVFTLSCLETLIREHCSNPTYMEAFKSAKKIYLLSDGSEKQNWSVQVFHNVKRLIKDLQTPDDPADAILNEVTTIEILKTVSGHGKESSNY